MRRAQLQLDLGKGQTGLTLTVVFSGKKLWYHRVTCGKTCYLEDGIKSRRLFFFFLACL